MTTLPMPAQLNRLLEQLWERGKTDDVSYEAHEVIQALKDRVEQLEKWQETHSYGF